MNPDTKRQLKIGEGTRNDFIFRPPYQDSDMFDVRLLLPFAIVFADDADAPWHSFYRSFMKSYTPRPTQRKR